MQFRRLVILSVLESACDGQTHTIDLSYSQSGSIFSPGYFNNYGNRKNCQWLIKASNGDRVLLYFTAFELEDNSQCSYDSVTIFDGQSSDGSLLSKSCGHSLPPPVYSSDRYIYMQFTSDGPVSRKGFVARYRALNRSSGCPLIAPGASAGVIYSPNCPWNYPNGTTCDWIITAPWQKTVNLNFTRFNLGSTFYGSCVDYVEVRYGFRSVKYCGSDFPSSITTSGSIRIRFYSDFGDSYSGFMAFYQSEYSFPSTPYPSWPISHPHIWSTYLRSETMRPKRSAVIRPTWSTFPRSVAIRPTRAVAILPTQSVAILPTPSVAILPTRSVAIRPT
ncbi:CUB domain-containing protein 2-like [Oculina patagonica]